MLNSITFSDGTGLKIDYINLYLDKDKKRKFGFDDSTKLKIFLPDWEKILSSVFFLDPFLRRYGIGQLYKFRILMYLEYFRITQFDYRGKYLRSSIKNTRQIKINSMEYRKTLLDLLSNEKRNNPKINEKDLQLKIEFSITDVTGHSVNKLFMSAAYNNLTEPEQTPLGQQLLAKQYFGRINKYIQQINVDTRKCMKYTDKEIAGLKRCLEEDPIIYELRANTSLEDTLKKVKELLSRFLPPESNIGQDRKKNKKRIVSKSELDSIVEETLNVLEEYYDGLKSTDKKEKIQKYIKSIKHYHTLPELNSLFVLVYINDEFSSKRGLIEHFNLQIEMLYRRCYREWAKKIFIELNEKEHLTKPEKRLFILMHIGTPYLNYRIPIFDTLLLNYLNFKNASMLTFFLSSILKIHKIDDIDLRMMNVQLFLAFLKFYEFWINFIRPADAERKQNVQFQKRFVADEYFEENVLKDLDLKEYQPKEELSESMSADYQELYSQDNKFDNDESENEPGDFTEKINHYDNDNEDTNYRELFNGNIKVKKPGFDFQKINNFNFKEYYFRDILEKYCKPDEQNLLERLFFNNETQEDIASDLKISIPAVNKRKKKIFDKLKGISELEYLFNTYNE